MIIKSCYIDNFGKLSNVKYIFDKNLTSINEENAWGKTTLANFIKAMLYGMEYNQKQINERKNYSPWNGGVYGGSMEIEVEGKCYTITRTFGRTNKEDTFSLIDMTTGKECDVFPQNVGEYLFKVNMESFSKSIYIPQSGIDTFMTDDINAKMGDLSHIKDDISSYEKVKNILEKKRKEFNPKISTSLSKKIKNEITNIEDKLRERDELYDNGIIKENIIKEGNANIKILEEKRKLYKERRDIQRKENEAIAFYKKAAKECEVLSLKQKQILAKYNGNMITQEELRRLEEIKGRRDSVHNELGFCDFGAEQEEDYYELKNIFQKAVPENYFFDEIQGTINEIERLYLIIDKEEEEEFNEEIYNKLNIIFEEYVPTEEEVEEQIDNYNNAVSIDKEINELTLQLSEIPRFKSIGKLQISIIIWLIVFGGGVCTFAFFEKYTMLISFLIVMLVIAIVYIFFDRTKSNNEMHIRVEYLRDIIDKQYHKKKALEKEYMSFIKSFLTKNQGNTLQVLLEIRDSRNKYIGMKEKYKKRREITTECKKKINELFRIINHKLSDYDWQCDDLNDRRDIQKLKEYILTLKNESIRYTSIEAIFKKVSQLKEQLQELNYEYEQIINIYGDDLQFNDISRDYYECKRLGEDIKIKRSELSQYKAQAGVKDSEVVGVEILDKLIDECDREIATIKDNVARYTRDLENDNTRIEELNFLEDELARLKNEYIEAEYNFELISKTMGYLEVAKNNYSSRYLGPIKDKFREYVHILNGLEDGNIPAESLDIDIDLNVFIREGAIVKGEETLSTGYKDLVGVCTRFALIDVMYQKELPIVILDDPFVNLDETKILNGVELIKEISKKYQVIYFTCHHSRDITL